MMYSAYKLNKQNDNIQSWLWQIVPLCTLGCTYLFELVFLCFLKVYPGVELLGHMVVLFLVFREISILSPQWLHKFIFPPTVYKGSLFSTFSSTFVIYVLSDGSHSDMWEVISHMILI